MGEPVTWQVLEHLRDAIKLIQVSRGYRTDLGRGVVALEVAQLPEDEDPYTLILSTEIPIDEEASQGSAIVSSMDIIIEFAVPFTSVDDAQLAAHRARADILRALYPMRRKPRERPACVRDFTLTGSRIGQPEAGATVIIAQVTARAGLIESLPPATP